jgi:hypothetical protein
MKGDVGDFFTHIQFGNEALVIRWKKCDEVAIIRWKKCMTTAKSRWNNNIKKYFEAGCSFLNTRFVKG